MCLRFMFLLITRTTSWLRLSRRQEAWKTAEILLLRHQLAVLQRQWPRRPRLDWADRALLATLLGVIPKARRQGLRLLVTPDTIVRWHRDIVRRRWASRFMHGRTGRPACSARKQDSPGDLQVFRALGGVGVFVDQSAQDRFSADPGAVDVGYGGAGSVRFVVGDALGYALVRPGRVVVHLILS
jgi:hypothetical protein